VTIENSIAFGALAVSIATVILGWLALRQKADTDYVGSLERRLSECERSRAWQAEAIRSLQLQARRDRHAKAAKEN
jgi:hypothetical protein